MAGGTERSESATAQVEQADQYPGNQSACQALSLRQLNGMPIQYVYDGEYVYAHSIDGMKVRMMRANPEVCFQVDRIVNFSNWQSIITWGTFEELTGEEAATATYMLAQRLTTLIASGLSLHDMKLTDSSRQKMIIYRIHLHEKTGRFESPLS